MTPMATAPEAFKMDFYKSVLPNNNVKSKPARIPLLRRQALGLWNYASYTSALLPNGQRPAAGYAVFGSKISLDRTVPFRTVQLNFDFDKNGLIGLEKMYCSSAQLFDLDNNGIAETNCYESLRVLSGATPRPFGQGESIDAVHASVVKFPTTVANRNALAKILAAYADGGFNVKWTNNTTTFVRLVPAGDLMNCIDEALCPDGSWQGFEDSASGGSTGSASGGSTDSGSGGSTGSTSGGNSTGGGMPMPPSGI
jgi:uncharacterized membrane protein YgcG